MLGFLSDRNKKKGLDLFGTGSVEVEFPELGTSVKNGGYSLYQKTKVSSAIDGGGMINLNWTNGWQPSINFNF